jgi:glycosyltransferase involved in cell wall biosynthesis
MKKISVVIPVYNGEAVIEKTLYALQTQSMPREDYEIICVDDCGTDKSVALINKFIRTDVKLNVIHHTFNRGTYASYNTGAKIAVGDVILFLDQDCVPDYFLLAEHWNNHNSSTEPIAVIGKFEWHKEMTVKQYLNFFRPNSSTLINEPKCIFDMELEQFITGNCSIKLNKFHEMDGFDEDFVYGFGDTEFGYRWRKKGYRIVGNLKAIVYHLHNMDFQAQLRRKYSIGTQASIYCQKHPELSHDAGIISARSKEYMNSLYKGVLDFFYYLGIRKSLNISSIQEEQLANSLLNQNWD